jgi:hypothetical protein
VAALSATNTNNNPGLTSVRQKSHYFFLFGIIMLLAGCSEGGSPGSPDTEDAARDDEVTLSGSNRIDGTYRLTVLSTTGTRYPENPDSLTLPVFLTNEADNFDMRFTFNSDGTYFAEGTFTLYSTQTYDGVTTSDVYERTSEGGRNMAGEWKIEGNSFLFTNDAPLAGLMSDGRLEDDPEFFEMIILETTNNKLTFEILTSIDFSVLAGYPSRLNRQGVVVFER